MNSEAMAPRMYFFPSRLPDETLHSRLSRLHTLSGNLDDRHTLQDAFGSHTLVATSHLPSHLNALASRLPDKIYCGPEDILEQATLLPYYRPFLQPAQVERCRAAMCSENGGDVKIGIGLVASRIGGHNAFRYCRQCRIEDSLQYGVAYWHRAHQLPGVWKCVTHAEPLIEVNHNWLCSHRHNLFLPVPEQFSGSLSERAIEVGHACCLAQCAALSAELLLSEQPPLDPSAVRSFYRHYATQRGWIDSHGRISTGSVQRAATEFCGKWPRDRSFEFLRDERWIFRLLHKHRGSMHPLKHVAMLILFGSNWRSLRDYCGVYRSLPICPPQCTRVHSPAKARMQVNIPRLTRPKTLKGDKLNRLRLALATPDSLAEIARAHSVSLPSLYRILRREPSVATARSDRFHYARRERFINELRSMPPRRAQDYMWLYRNDRAWLDQQVTFHLKTARKPGKLQADWNMRDIKLTQAVRHWAMVFYATVPPVRVSTTLLARCTGKQATIEKYASRLPLTMAALAEATESVEHFQCRRLEWTGKVLANYGHVLSPWKVLRIAGLNRPLAPAQEGTLATIAGIDSTASYEILNKTLRKVPGCAP